jgi:hypothetical protein
VPKRADAEALTMDVIGERLGLDHDAAIDAFFRRHDAAWFPTLTAIHRTTFARQATNLWVVKARVWQAITDHVPHDPHVALIHSSPLPLCRFGRDAGSCRLAKRCRRVGGLTTIGYEEAARQTFYRFRCHVRLA